jgi:hypothetical protein
LEFHARTPAWACPRYDFRHIKLSYVLLCFCSPVLKHPLSKVALSIGKGTILLFAHVDRQYAS